MEFIILMIIGASIYYFLQNSKKENLRNNLGSTKRFDQKIADTKQTVHNTKSEYSQKITSDFFPSNSTKKIQPSSFNGSIDDQEESLITITISSGRTEQISSNKAPGRWIQPGEIIKIKHFETKSGLFYFGGKLTAYQGNSSYYNRTETEASLVDDSLPIINKDQFFTDDSLDYWPKYIELSPADVVLGF